MTALHTVGLVLWTSLVDWLLAFFFSWRWLQGTGRKTNGGWVPFPFHGDLRWSTISGLSGVDNFQFQLNFKQPRRWVCWYDRIFSFKPLWLQPAADRDSLVVSIVANTVHPDLFVLASFHWLTIRTVVIMIYLLLMITVRYTVFIVHKMRQENAFSKPVKINYGDNRSERWWWQGPRCQFTVAFFMSSVAVSA